MATTTVTGLYLDPSGDPCRGRVTFKLVTAAYQEGLEALFVPVSKTVILDEDGAFTVELEPTSGDDAAFDTTDMTYQVTEKISGAEPRVYWVDVTTAPSLDIGVLQTYEDPPSFVRQLVIVDIDDVTTLSADVDALEALTATLTPLATTRSLSLASSPAAAAVVEAEAGQPRIADVWGGYVWGFKANGTIWRQPEAGGAWAQYATAPDGAMDSRVGRILPCSDGEVLVCSGDKILKSSDWDNGPTWTTKVSTAATNSLLRFGFDGDPTGTYFICTEYSATRADSRLCHTSVDGGDTWVEAYDSVTVHGALDADNSHLHGCAVDYFADPVRFILSEGHGTIAGLYYATVDDVTTWARPTGCTADPSPTVVVATDDGLVCGSDNVVNGLYGVARAPDPADEVLALTWQWQSGRVGLVGFGDRGFRDPATGEVLVGFTSDYDTVLPVIAGGTPGAGGLVYTWEDSTDAGDRIGNVVVADGSRLLALLTNGSTPDGHLEAVKLPPGKGNPVNTGNIDGGSSAGGDSVAVGPQADTGSGVRNTAVGKGAIADGSEDSTSLGAGADAEANATAIGAAAAAVTTSVAVGDDATASGSNSVAVGEAAIASGASSTATGRGAVASNTDSAAHGRGATASGSEASAYGRAASAVATRGTAVGKSASVPTGHTSSVALGYSQTTTAEQQIKLGAKHLELSEVASPPDAPDADMGRVFVRDNGAGKTQLVVRFPTGAVQVIATEP